MFLNPNALPELPELFLGLKSILHDTVLFLKQMQIPICNQDYIQSLR
jgi:hypothetical protein